jgi:hypothetical protein
MEGGEQGYKSSAPEVDNWHTVRRELSEHTQGKLTKALRAFDIRFTYANGLPRGEATVEQLKSMIEQSGLATLTPKAPYSNFGPESRELLTTLFKNEDKNE